MQADRFGDASIRPGSRPPSRRRPATCSLGLGALDSAARQVETQEIVQLQVTNAASLTNVSNTRRSGRQRVEEKWPPRLFSARLSLWLYGTKTPNPRE